MTRIRGRRSIPDRPHIPPSTFHSVPPPLQPLLSSNQNNALAQKFPSQTPSRCLACTHRHADRWEQARTTGDDRDNPAVVRSGKHATGASASTAAVDFAARESASVARGVAAAQAAAEAALVGLPPLLPGGGGGSGFNRGGPGERGGTAQGGERGEGLPCRLEGRVEDWKPPAVADLRSSYRWADEQKV